MLQKYLFYVVNIQKLYGIEILELDVPYSRSENFNCSVLGTVVLDLKILGLVVLGLIGSRTGWY
jgi:hypothetical protein